MSIRKVESFMTTDGQMFPTKELAEAHQALFDFREWYEYHELYGNYAGSRVNYDNLTQWLLENREKVQEFYSGMKVISGEDE